MIEKVKNLLDKGFFHIFGSNVINKIIQFASSIFIVRLISKEEFGLYSYAQNILSIFLLLNGLGVTTGMLQFGSETEDLNRRNSFFSYGFKIGMSFNIMISLFIVLYSKFLPLKIEAARPLLLLMFLLPTITFVYETIQVYFRASIENKKFSFLSTLNTFLIFVFSVVGALLFNILGIIIFRYIAYFITIILGYQLLGKDIKIFLKGDSLDKEEKGKFLKFSIVSSFNNAIAQLLYTIDIFLIGLIIVDETVIAAYKTATLIPFALNFIPMSIMVFIYPYFAKNNTNKGWIKSNYIRLTKYLLALNILISTFLIVFAPLIIKLVFGSQYLDSVVSFRILSFGYLVASSFRIPIGNILGMMKKIKFGFYLSIITGISNIILDVVLIKSYGSVGAAIATVSVYIFTSIIGFIYLLYILRDKRREL